MKDYIRKAAMVIPSRRQLAWQKLEFNAFIHFTVNTFTDREWGLGDEDPAIFKPTELNADQWVKVCKSAGMRGIILTCKHHDGFCLWPSRYTGHSVKSSPWRDGNGDLVRELSDACRRVNLKFGIYLSPWDRHEKIYGDSELYNEYFRNQLRELLTGYGEIFAVWFDGACGEGPNGKRQVYDWDGYYSVIRELQPEAVICVCGPDVRWCGNEAGHCRESEWSVVPAILQDAEKVAEKSQKEDDGKFSKRITIGMNGKKTFNRVVLMENIESASQRVEEFVLEIQNEDGWKEIYRGTVIGYKRICCFETVEAKYMRLTITQSRWYPTIAHLGVFLDKMD